MSFCILRQRRRRLPRRASYLIDPSRTHPTFAAMPCLASYTAVRYLQALTPDRAHIRGARTAELYPRRPSFLMHARNSTISYPAKRSDSCEAFDRRAKVLREKADHRPTHLLYAWTNGSACKCCERRMKNASRARLSNTSATAVARGDGLGWWLCCRLAAAGRTCHSPTLRKAAPFSRPACHLPDGATAVGCLTAPAIVMVCKELGCFSWSWMSPADFRHVI
jgi:hypothetical protein